MDTFKRTFNWKIVARLIISAGLLTWLSFNIDWKDIARVWHQVELVWILGAVAWIIISMIISVRKWQLVLEAQDIHLPWPELWQAYWAGLFFNNFLPSSIGGDALRIWWIGKTVLDNPGAAASVITERILATLGLALTGLTASALIGRADSRVVSLLAILTVASLSLLALVSWGSLPERIKLSQGRIFSFLSRMAEHGKKYRQEWGRLVMAGVLSAAFQIAVVAVNYCIFRSLHINALSVGDMLYVIPVISVAAMLPLGINGYGLREGAYVALLAGYGIPAGTAFSASLLFVFLVSLCSLYGGCTWYNRHRKGDIANDEMRSVTDSAGRDEVW